MRKCGTRFLGVIAVRLFAGSQKIIEASGLLGCKELGGCRLSTGLPARQDKTRDQSGDDVALAQYGVRDRTTESTAINYHSITLSSQIDLSLHSNIQFTDIPGLAALF